MPVLVDVVSGYHKYLYDKVAFAVNTALPNPIQFFTVPIGQGVSPTAGAGAKQIQDTNIDDGQRLPNPMLAFTLQSIRVQVMGGATATPVPTVNDVARLLRNYILRLWISNKVYLDTPLNYVPGGGGLQYQGQLSTALLALTTGTFGAASGIPSDTAKFVLAKPIKWNSAENFRVELVGSTFTTDNAGGTTLGNGLLIEIGLEGGSDEAIAS
jgi:hypothetical protein